MYNYPKIQTLFKRDAENIIIPTQYTTEEFEYLKDNLWECTEKIDGTNIHIDLVPKEGIQFDGTSDCVDMYICGRTDKAEIPKHLLEKLNSLFNKDTLVEYFYKSNGNTCPVSIYGEGYGIKIQKGGNYIKDGVNFILFDIKVGNMWLKRSTLEVIANELHIDIVPFVGYMTIPQAIEYVKKGFKSVIAENKDYNAEGLVLKTPSGLLLRNGERLITKIKTMDFNKFTARYGENYTGEQPVNPFINYEK